MARLIPKYQTGGLLDTDTMRKELKDDEKFFKDGAYTIAGRKRLAAIQQISANQDKGLTYEINEDTNTFNIKNENGDIIKDGDGHGMLENEGVNNPLYGLIGRKNIAKKEVSKAMNDSSKYRLIPRVEETPSVELSSDEEVVTAGDVEGYRTPVGHHQEGITEHGFLSSYAPSFDTESKILQPKVGGPYNNSGTGRAGQLNPDGTVTDGIVPLLNMDELPDSWKDWEVTLDDTISKLYTGAIPGYRADDVNKVGSDPQLYQEELDRRLKGVGRRDYLDKTDAELVALREAALSNNKDHYVKQAEFTSNQVLDYLNSEIERLNVFSWTSQAEKAAVIGTLLAKKKAIIDSYTEFTGNVTTEGYDKFYNGSAPMTNKSEANGENTETQYFWDNENKIVSTNRTITNNINDFYKSDFVNEEDWSKLTDFQRVHAQDWILHKENVDNKEFNYWLKDNSYSPANKTEFLDLLHQFRVEYNKAGKSYAPGSGDARQNEEAVKLINKTNNQNTGGGIVGTTARWISGIKLKNGGPILIPKFQSGNPINIPGDLNDSSYITPKPNDEFLSKLMSIVATSYNRIPGGLNNVNKITPPEFYPTSTGNRADYKDLDTIPNSNINENYNSNPLVINTVVEPEKDKRSWLNKLKGAEVVHEGGLKDPKKPFTVLSKTGINTPVGQVQYNDIAQFIFALRAKNKKLDEVELNLQKFTPAGSRNVLAARDMDSAMLNKANQQISRIKSQYAGSDPVMSMIASSIAGEAKSNAEVNLIANRAAYRRGEEDRVASEMELKRQQESQDAVRAGDVDNANNERIFQTNIAKAQDKARRDNEFMNTVGSLASSFQSRANMKAQGDKQLKTELAARDYQVTMSKLNSAYRSALDQKSWLDTFGGTEEQHKKVLIDLNKAAADIDNFTIEDRKSVESQAEEINRGKKLFSR